MTVKVAKSALGLSGNDYTINFSWTDNVHDEGDETKFSGDIMDFYISGDVAPGARFKYSYISTEANANGEQEQETTEGTESSETDVKETEPSNTEAPVTGQPSDATEAPTDGETENKSHDKGCASVAATAGVVMAMAAAAVALRKGKDD